MAFLSVRDEDKKAAVAVAQKLHQLGFQLMATRGTCKVLMDAGLPVEFVYKVIERERPHIVDHMKNGRVQMVINTVGDKKSQVDSYSIRRTAVTRGIPYFTTLSGAGAAVEGIEALLKQELTVVPLQEYHKAAKNQQ